MSKQDLIKIARKFRIDGNITNIEECSSGHINKTYVVEYKTENNKYKKYKFKILKK